jgi:hypothetical protein
MHDLLVHRKRRLCSAIALTAAQKPTTRSPATRRLLPTKDVSKTTDLYSVANGARIAAN